MKKILSVLVAVLLVAFACIPAFAADEAKIEMVPSATEAAVGDVITISFNVSEGLTGVDALVKYDTEYLEYVKDSAVATDLMVTELNTETAGAGSIHVASAKTDPAEAGTLFTAKFKVKKANAEITADLNEVLDASDNDIAPGMTVAPITIAEKAADDATTTTTAPATTAPATTKAADNKGGNSINPPKTGNTPVIGSVAAILVASAAVAVVMKKKNED